MIMLLSLCVWCVCSSEGPYLLEHVADGGLLHGHCGGCLLRAARRVHAGRRSARSAAPRGHDPGPC